MNTLKYEGHSGNEDTGIDEFSFIFNNDRYHIIPKIGVPGSKDKLIGFWKFVQYIAPKLPDKNPWMYRVNTEQNFSKVFDIYKNGKKLDDKSEISAVAPTDSPVAPIAPVAPQKPEAEQMEMTFTASLDRISDRLERKGYIKEAYELDVIANTLSKWQSNKSNLFFDEIQNRDIDVQDATSVLSAFVSSDGKIDDTAKKSGKEPKLCHEIVGIAMKSGLLTKWS